MKINQSISQEVGGGKFVANLLHFGRILRQAGIPVSTNQVCSFAEGLYFINLYSREDFYHAARAFFLHDISRLRLFDLAFDLFWSQYLQLLIDLPGTKKQGDQPAHLDPDHDSIILGSQRIDARKNLPGNNLALDNSSVEVQPLYSPDEILRQTDFGDFSDEEFLRAKSIIKDMNWSLDQKRSRRKIKAQKRTNLIDRRRSIRNYLGFEDEFIDLEWRKFKYKPRPVVLICDISGSMERYSKVFLHLLYAMVQETKQIETFVFGTRLTRLTKQLRHADIDQVLENLSVNIIDWSGGTRIGESLKTFNYSWSRRIPSQGSIVIIISDGWDRGDHILLEREISRLKRIAHRLIWLNPLSGSEEYQPLVQGIKTVMPYVDDFLPLANLQNLEALAEKLDSL